MPFAARSATDIRTELLTFWRAGYLELGVDLDIQEGSDAYNEADALSYELEGLELAAQGNAVLMLIALAVGPALDQFAVDDGTARNPASTAQYTVTVTGPISASTPINGATLSSAAGQIYQPIDPTTGLPLAGITTDGSGNATITINAQTAGVIANVPTGTILTWSSAPTGFGPLATVFSIVRIAQDPESDTALRMRLIERRKEKPASGNRADWRSWGQAVEGVGDCFVHPCTQPPNASAAPPRLGLTANKPGCVTVLPVNPSPDPSSYVQNADGSLGAGLDPGYSRVPSTGLCTDVAGYIDGTLDASGTAVPATGQTQLYPGVMDRTNWDVVPASAGIVNVNIEVSTTPDFLFTDSRNVLSSPAPTATQFALSSGVSVGIGSAIAIACPLSVLRGGYMLATVTAFDPTGNVVTVHQLPAAPAVGASVVCDPGCWSLVLAAVLAYFDSLGPGDPSGLGRSSRFPDPSWGASDTVVPARIASLVLNVPGVTDVSVTLPASRIQAALGGLLVPGTITIQRMP